MDSNDPTNPNSNPAGGAPVPLDSGSTPPAQPPPFSFNQPQNPSEQIISDIPQLPPNTGVPPHASAGSPWGPPEAPQSPAPASPWETTAPAETGSPPVAPGYMPLPDPTTPTSPAPSPQSPWAPSQPATTPADIPTAPPAPSSPDASNPFLQPQAGANFSVPQTSFDQMPQAGPPPPPTATPIPNPNATSAPDPLNTAFSPTGSLSENPFAQPQMPSEPSSTPPSPATAAPVSPWESSPNPTPGEIPSSEVPGSAAQSQATTGFISTPPENPAEAMGQPGSLSSQSPAIIDQTIPSVPQSGTLDLSSLQNAPGAESPQPSPAEATNQPGSSQNNPQGNSPVENAPTDLSHLIASDESTTSQPMSNVYSPPVAPDQTPGTALPQTPSTEGGSVGPPEKHLNLTKVLLVAGIPIILVVAALSAYLILGVGKAAPESDTSLPVEQTKQDQAPLTNPPQQIVAPSPATIPEPSVTSSTPSSFPVPALPTLPAISASPSPAASLSPAIRAAQQKASASPVSSPTPSSSASTSLPQ